MTRVVVVDDDRAMCDMLAAALRTLGFEVTTFDRADPALEHILSTPTDIVLTDVRMPGSDGLDLCTQVHVAKPRLPVIVLTGFGSLDAAVQAMRAGAYDFLSKPVELEELEFAVQRAAEKCELTRQVRKYRLASRRPDGLHGDSPGFLRVVDQIPRAAASDLPVLIQGETGTGKELFARALHEASPRAEAPFVAVNCAAIPEGLIESELFGHVRGAFTSASAERTGLFVQAGEGTLFLDEVGELPLQVQPKLLRLLQERAARPVGSDSEVPVRCRIIAATNIDLRAAAECGRFRSDLYYRLAVIELSLPPLRDRVGDILGLAQLFIARWADATGVEAPELTQEAARRLVAYGWPGNVRELENAIARAVAMVESAEITVTDLPEPLHTACPSTEEPLLSLAAMERAHIRRVLDATGGNKKAAAELLGVDRRTLYRKLERDPRD